MLGDRIQQRRANLLLPLPDCICFLLQADQSRVLFQQPPDPFPGKLLFQRIQDHPAAPLRLPAHRVGHGLARWQFHVPAGRELRHRLPRFIAQEGSQGSRLKRPVHRLVRQPARETGFHHPADHKAFPLRIPEPRRLVPGPQPQNHPVLRPVGQLSDVVVKKFPKFSVPDDSAGFISLLQ